MSVQKADSPSGSVEVINETRSDSDQDSDSESSRQVIVVDAAQLKQRFTSLDTPFAWGLPVPSTETKIWRQINRLRDSLLIPHSSWGCVVAHISISWLFFKAGDFEQSRQELVEADIVLNTLDWTTGDASLLRRYEVAVRHVLDSSWMCLTRSQKTRIFDLLPELDQIVPVENFDSEQRSALYGLQAACRFCFFEWVGFKLMASAIRARELNPREPEWQLFIGDNRFSLDGDSFTPHIAILMATWHVQKNNALQAQVVLERSLEAWPRSAFVYVNAACMFAREKSPVRDLVMAEMCSAQALCLAPSCVAVHLVRKLVETDHESSYLDKCEETYGKSAADLMSFVRAGAFGFELITRGFFCR